MNLITLAHHGEAQGIIEALKLKRLNQDTFHGENCILVLTGEGPFEALARTALAIPAYKIQRIINIGIAGSLCEELKPRDLISVRTTYLISEEKPHFKSFQSHPDGVDCLTSFERILDPEKALKYRGMGKIVDREAWGVAFAAKSAGLPFESYKVISDKAGTLDACELVREKAPIYSQIIADKITELLSEVTPSAPEQPEIAGLHFTFSTGHRFRNLMKKLSIKKELTETEVLKDLNLKAIQDLDILPKERTRRLLELMELELDPVKRKLHSVSENLTREIKNTGCDLSIDPQWENPKVKITIEAGSDQELQEKLQRLKGVSLSPFKNLMEGKL